MRNCHHFPLSLQFLYYSLSDLHNRTHLNRTVRHALERNLQNLISKDKIPLAEKLFHLQYTKNEDVTILTHPLFIFVPGANHVSVRLNLKKMITLKEKKRNSKTVFKLIK